MRGNARKIRGNALKNVETEGMKARKNVEICENTRKKAEKPGNGRNNAENNGDRTRENTVNNGNRTRGNTKG